MTQEATMIALDNSSYMRNEDFIPDRFFAQREAIHFICNALKRQNPENTCGLLTLSNCEILCTLTLDTTKIFSKVNEITPDGEISFCTSVSIAHLVLRNRQRRNQKPKLCMFIGSPVKDSEEELIRIARKLKKEKISVIIINFGESLHNEEKLIGFINILNGTDLETSQIISIPSGNGILEYLKLNPIFVGNNADNQRSSMDFGVFLNNDPELEYALRVSLEDQRQLQGQPTVPDATILSDRQPTTNEESALTQSVLNAIAAHEEAKNFETSTDLQGMTEEEQISYAINISLTAMQHNDDSDSKADKLTAPKNKKTDEKKTGEKKTDEKKNFPEK